MDDLIKHAMIDWETFSLRKNAMLLCVGVVIFDKATECINKQVWHLDLTEQKRLGRDIDPETVIWWMQQSKAAQEIVFGTRFEPVNRVPISKFLFELKEFLFWNDVSRVWSKGPSADAAWLEDLASDMELPCPVHYRDHRDVRTIIDGKELPEIDQSDIVPHDPISDCIAQVREVRAAWLS